MARKSTWDVHSITVRGRLYFNPSNINDEVLRGCITNGKHTLDDMYNKVTPLSNTSGTDVNWSKIPHRSIFDMRTMEDQALREHSTIPLINEYTIIVGRISGWNSDCTYLCAKKLNNNWIGVSEDPIKGFVDRFNNHYKHAEKRYRIMLSIIDKSCLRDLRVTCYDEVAENIIGLTVKEMETMKSEDPEKFATVVTTMLSKSGKFGIRTTTRSIQGKFYVNHLCLYWEETLTKEE